MEWKEVGQCPNPENLLYLKSGQQKRKWRRIVPEAQGEWGGNTSTVLSVSVSLPRCCRILLSTMLSCSPPQLSSIFHCWRTPNIGDYTILHIRYLKLREKVIHYILRSSSWAILEYTPHEKHPIAKCASVNFGQCQLDWGLAPLLYFSYLGL